jgi:hypothetical protein
MDYPKPWETNGRPLVVAPSPIRVVPPKNETLMEQTRRMLRESGMSLPLIYAELREQGSDITYFWLRKFSSGKVRDPGVNKVETLNRYLRGLPFLKNAS